MMITKPVSARVESAHEASATAGSHARQLRDSAGEDATVTHCGPRVCVVFDRDADGVHCFWQLTARNGRVLGRSAPTFADEVQARAHLAQVSRGGARLALVVSHAEQRAGWIWRVDEARTNAVIRSHRTYERYDSCRRAGRQLLDAVASLVTGDLEATLELRDVRRTRS